jgi:predicted dehydrogenase
MVHREIPLSNLLQETPRESAVGNYAAWQPANGGLMHRVRWGVLSTAKIGREKVIPAIQAEERSEVVAIASRNLEQAEAVATALGIERAYGSYGQLLSEPDIDAVYIPLPNHMHAEWTIAAAREGKHVLCEKPIALTTTEAEAMVAAAAEADVVMREAFMYQFHPTWIAARRLVDEGAIGDLVAIDSWFSFYNDDPGNIRNILEYGGGALMDIGCYSIHLSRLLLGSEPTAIKASVRRDPATGVDIYTAGILEFGERIATFACSTRVEADQRVDIYGSRGRISIDIPFNIPSRVPTRVAVTVGGDPPVAPATRTIEFEPVDQYELQAKAFVAAILDGASVPDSGAAAIDNLRTIERVFAAAGPSGWT